jgi:glycosyltransferase involved in cell wall biosynthesis
MAAASRPRILFVAPRFPFPPHRGDQRRVFHFLEGLAERAEVTLVSFGDPGEELPLDGVRAVTVAHGLPAAVAANLREPRPRVPLQVRLFLQTRMRRAVERELAAGPDVVHVTLARMGPYLPGPGPWHRHVDLVDSLALNMATRASADALPLRPVFAAEARLMRRYEAGLVRAADSTSIVSEADRAAVPGLESAAVVPNGVDTEAFPFRDPAAEPRAPRLLFFGNLGYFHNVEPARDVARDVLPRVRREIPEARLRIAGARPAAQVRRLERLDGVELAPDVPSMADELHAAAVAVLPMFSGSGIKNKVLEAFCAGTPVVANRAGVEGVTGAEAGRHYLEGASADELAAACVRLLREPAEGARLAREGLGLVHERFTWARQVDALAGLYGIGASAAPSPTPSG